MSEQTEDEVRNGLSAFYVRVGQSSMWGRHVWMLSGEDWEDSKSVHLRPEDARALAALLLKHADRAEGRGT